MHSQLYFVNVVWKAQFCVAYTESCCGDGTIYCPSLNQCLRVDAVKVWCLHYVQIQARRPSTQAHAITHTDTLTCTSNHTPPCARRAGRKLYFTPHTHSIQAHKTHWLAHTCTSTHTPPNLRTTDREEVALATHQFSAGLLFRYVQLCMCTCMCVYVRLSLRFIISSITSIPIQQPGSPTHLLMHSH